MFGLFMAFLVVLDLSLHQISTMDILTLIKYLMEFGMSPDNIVNYLTAIRCFCINRIPLFVKSLKINRRFQPKLSFVVDEHLLLNMITVSQHLPHSLVFDCLIY